jgi:hypothetical protein
MDRDVMLFTRWIRLVALVAATAFMLFTGGTLGYVFAVVCVAFLGLTVWQLLKLYRDDRYRT